MKRKTKSIIFILSTIGRADITPNIPTAPSGAVGSTTKAPNKNVISMDTKADFHKTIYNHLHGLANGKISDALLEELTERINNYYFEQYSRFAKQYPKSVLRYSTFQIVDLEHPTTYEMIIAFFKDKLGENYAHASEIILKMSSSELKEFEKSRIDFQNMF